jgi:sugar phosphate permease
LPKSRIHYGWIVALLTFLTMLAAAGALSSAGVLIVPLEKWFGWRRATVSSAVSLRIVLYGLIGPFAAAFMERFGIRFTMVLALVITATGIALTTLVTAPWQLILLWGVVVGCGTGMTGMTMGAVVVNRWFKERRGLVMGLLTASSATGQLLFLPLMASVIVNRGWQTAVLLIAGAMFLMVAPVAIFVRNRPEDIGLLAVGQVLPAATTVSRVPRSPVATAFRCLVKASYSRQFWLLFASFFVCGASTAGLIGTHLVPACMDHGIPEVRAAGLLAMMGVFDLIGTTLSGWLSDRWDSRYLLFWYYGLRGLALIYLPYAMDMSFYGLPLFAVFYGLDWIATVPPTVRLVTENFGTEDGGVVWGWLVAGHQVGGGLAALAAGVVRTVYGSYLFAFISGGVLCVVAALLVLGLDRGQEVLGGQTASVQPSASAVDLVPAGVSQRS